MLSQITVNMVVAKARGEKNKKHMIQQFSTTITEGKNVKSFTEK
jgi:hypothetical protein